MQCRIKLSVLSVIIVWLLLNRSISVFSAINSAFVSIMLWASNKLDSTSLISASFSVRSCRKWNNRDRGFGEPDAVEQLWPSSCPACGKPVEPVTGAPKKIQQVVELVEQPVEIREYQRSRCQCFSCGWSGYAPLPWGE